MKKKNSLPIPWILGILFLLMLIPCWTIQQKNHNNQGVLSAGSTASSHVNFFQFLANILGLGNPFSSSGEGTSNENNLFNQNNPALHTKGYLQGRSGNGSSTGTVTDGTSLNGQTPQEEGSNAGQGINGENNSGNNAENNASENNAEANANNNGDTGSSGDTNNNSESNSGNDSENNAENNAQNNADQGPATSSGDNSGGSSENNPGGSSGSNSGDNSGNNSGNSPFANMPTLNPIPSDTSVAQTTAQQDQQINAMTALLAARQALVAPVQQQAQTSKYQPVNSQNITVPSTNQPPADVLQKVNAHQLTLH